MRNRPFRGVRLLSQIRNSTTSRFPKKSLVHQSLAFSAVDGRYHPLAVAHLPVIPHKAPLVNVTVKVLFTHLVEDAIMRLLQQGKERFGRVRSHQQAVIVRASVLLLAVVDRVVPALEVVG